VELLFPFTTTLESDMGTTTMRMTAKDTILARYRAVIAVAVRLIGQCNESDKANPATTSRLFKKMRDLIDRIGLARCGFAWEPLSHGCERLIEKGEYRAARADLVRMVRQMRNVRDTWPAEAEVEIR
jgi:hypothetical protein